MIELTLTPYWEQKALRAAQRGAQDAGKRVPTVLSLKALQTYVDLIPATEFRYDGMVPKELPLGRIYAGQQISKADLLTAGIGSILVRWDRDRNVNQLRIR
jgi:hypothetical protein